MIFERWDVVVAPYPFIEIFEVKRRPALVISTRSLQQAHSVCLAAMITTARNMTDLKTDDIALTDLNAAGLRQPCVVRLSRLHTLELTDDVRKIGVVARPVQRQVTATLRRWLKL